MEGGIIEASSVSAALADLEQQVPGQCGVAVLDVKDGGVLKRSGDLANSEDGLAICKALYDMLLNCAQSTDGETLRRVVITFDAAAYIVAPGKQHVFIVKTPPSGNS